LDRTETARYLSMHFSAWAHLSDEEREGMLANTTLMRYAKGTCIHSGDNDCKGMLIVKKGTLRTYMLSENGREITLFRQNEGDVCILSASCVLAAITFDVHIDAEEDSEVLLVALSFFQDLIERNIYVECFAYKLIADRFSDVMWTIQQILFMSMDKRLAVFLWDELSKTDDDTVHLTHEQIARDIGSAREVVSRMLKYFSSESIVELSRGGIKVLDRKKLRKLAE
jgi:CRP/FNR family transcriptional regulator